MQKKQSIACRSSAEKNYEYVHQNNNQIDSVSPYDAQHSAQNLRKENDAEQNDVDVLL